MIALGLQQEDILVGGVAAHHQEDVGMLGNKLFPDLYAIVVASVVIANTGVDVRGRGNVATGGGVVIGKVIAVKSLIAVGRNDNSVFRMRKNNLVCPFEHLVTCAEIERHKEILGLTDGKELIGVADVVSTHKAVKLAHVGFVCEILEEVFRFVVVPSYQGVRDHAVELGNILLRSDPLRLLAGGVPILSNITEAEDVSNLLRILVCKDPVVNALHLFGLVLGQPLGVANYREGISIIHLRLMAVQPFPGDAVAVAGQVLDVLARVVFAEQIGHQQIIGVKVGSVLGRSRDLLGGSDIGVSRHRADLALEVNAVVGTVITADDELVPGNILRQIGLQGNSLGQLTVYIQGHGLAGVVESKGDM